MASIDGQPKQVLIEATILSVSLEEGMQFGVEFTALFGQDFEDGGFTSPDGLSLVPGGFTGEQLDEGLGNTSTNTLGSFLSGGLSIGYLNDGTMVVINGAQTVIGQQAQVQVQSLLQTGAGVIIFAELKLAAAA